MNAKLRSARGFTLIEIMTMLVIVGILAAVAAPRFQTVFEKTRFRSANRDMISTLRLARSMAITDKQQYGVHFSYANHTVTIFKDSINPTGYIFDGSDPVIRVDTIADEFANVYTDVENDVITFGPNGSAGFSGGGNIAAQGYFPNWSAEYYHNVLASTGRVRSYDSWEEWAQNHYEGDGN